MRAIAAGVVAASLGACAGTRGAGGAGNGASTPLPPPDPNALLPERMEIHPLTRIGTDLSGKPILICHIELRDHFAQSVKALGRLRVEMYGRGAGSEAGGDKDGAEAQELVWDEDLTDPGTNAEYYDDLVTRTYALSLGSIPAWVVQWARSDRTAGSGPTLAAVFEFADEKGKVQTLRAAAKLLR